MRGIFLVTALLFVFEPFFAQLNVNPSGNGQKSNYLYVKGDVLYVQNDIRLMKNPEPGSESSIYLRGGAQLLQGEQQTKANSGTGSISIFAEGSTNAYDYNYWSSPVTAPANDLFGISLLHAPVSDIISKPAQITTALNGTANPLTISTRWIYTFTGNQYSNWNFIGGSTGIPPAYGFTMKGTDGQDPVSVDGRPNNPGNAQRYDFRGKPNSGVIEIPISPENFVLVGNPYPSAFDLSLFLLENSGTGVLKSNCYAELDRRNVTTGIAYFWDSKKDGNSHYLEDYMGGYGAFSPIDPCTTGVYEPPVFKKISGAEDGSKGKYFHRRDLPVAQGFMVQGAENGKMIFRNAHRRFIPDASVKSSSIPANSEKKHLHSEENRQLSVLRINVSVNDQYERSLSLAFWNEATPGIDPGMDAETFEVAPTDAGWLLDDKSFVIDVRPFDILEEIPLFIQVEEQLPKMTFSEGNATNATNREIFIVDTQSNDYFSISKEPLTLELEPGTYHGRYKVAFAEKIPQEELPQKFFEDETVAPKFDIFQNNRQGELQIIGNDYFPVKAIGIFDLQGKRILYRSNFDNRRSIEISTLPWPNGVYIVKVTGMDNQKTVKKISIYNN
ncbi:T9SS type A sorting domain-containing protein [Salinimicrobium sp. HB62]|uniref:T9SS type A sorting domain-containing protein n=1 Tax=Salinimicrobium sp. HB62 TaxID=3077781 RepID=UPI002D7A1112|nr:T9SS type A sorting domain-containing protein [Salinimicrobium sp. HB62]